MKISNKLYDILKWVVIIVLPAVATLYAALSAVWAWPYSEEVDPFGSDRVYTETENKLPEKDEKM